MTLLVVLIIEVIYHNKDIVHILPYLSVILVGLIFIVAYRIFKKIKLRHYLASLNEVDAMSGVEFEQYIAKLLRRNGFSNVSLTEKYDMGVDVVAEKNGERWGIQTKRYNDLVKASAVRQVIAGLNSYNCTRAMVMTNSSFSNYAIKLARSNHCILIDRMELAKLINDTPPRP